MGSASAGGERGVGHGGGLGAVDVVWFEAHFPGDPLIDSVQPLGEIVHGDVGRSAAIARTERREEAKRKDGGGGRLSRSGRLEISLAVSPQAYSHIFTKGNLHQ